jgi:hypothetical protein
MALRALIIRVGLFELFVVVLVILVYRSTNCWEHELSESNVARCIQCGSSKTFTRFAGWRVKVNAEINQCSIAPWDLYVSCPWILLISCQSSNHNTNLPSFLMTLDPLVSPVIPTKSSHCVAMKGLRISGSNPSKKPSKFWEQLMDCLRNSQFLTLIHV